MVYRFCEMDTHDDLVRWFCESMSGTVVYMGDRELIVGKLRTWQRNGRDCGVERPQGADFLTYEPYALLVSSENPELVQFVQRRVYEIFSNRAGADALFRKHFPAGTMSAALAYLYLLNAVEEESLFVAPCAIEGDLEDNCRREEPEVAGLPDLAELAAGGTDVVNPPRPRSVAP